MRERDLEYRRDGETPLLAHLYEPDGTGPFPAIVDVHGGAWTMGDRLNNRAIDVALAQAGIVVLALDFRMPPGIVYPASVADVNAGIRWLKAHAAELHTRADLVGGLGTSSGGNTLLLAVMRPSDPRYAALPVEGAAGIDATLQYAMLGWPISDPLARYRMAQATDNELLIKAHGAYWQTEERMAEGNPTLILERGERVNTPPLLYLQGTNDENVTPDMADRFAAAYGAAGGGVRLEKFAGEPHTFIKNDLTSEAAQRALELMIAFVRTNTAHAATA
jgi:acetyl esterase